MVIVIIVAMLPGEVCSEGGKQVVDGPGNDDVVIDTNEALCEDVCKAKSFEHRRYAGIYSSRAHC